MKKLIVWYNSKTTRQLNILRLCAFLLSVIPLIGWFLIAPWMVPLILYLEFHLKSDISKQP